MASKVVKLERTLSNLRKKGKEKAKQGGHVAVALAGAGGLGFLRGRFPNIRKVGDLDSDLVIGTVLVGLGVAEVGGTWSDELLFAGVGILSPSIERKLFIMGQNMAAAANQ